MSGSLVLYFLETDQRSQSELCVDQEVHEFQCQGLNTSCVNCIRFSNQRNRDSLNCEGMATWYRNCTKVFDAQCFVKNWCGQKLLRMIGLIMAGIVGTHQLP